MALTIDQVLRWDAGVLEASGASLHSSSTSVAEIAAALSKSTGHGGRSIGQSWLASSWSGPSALAAQGAAREITKNLEGLSECLEMAGQAMQHCATKIVMAQEKLRSVKDAVASHDGMTLHSDGRVVVPAYVEPDASDSPFGQSDFQGEANNALLLQGQAQEALTNARLADEQLSAYLRYYFEGVELPSPSMVAVVASTILDLIPFVGAVKVYIESAMGENILTGEMLSDEDRILGAVTAGVSTGAVTLRFGEMFMRESNLFPQMRIDVARPPIDVGTRPIVAGMHPPVPGAGQARPIIPNGPPSITPAAIYTDPSRVFHPTLPWRDTDGYATMVHPNGPAETALAHSIPVARQPWSASGINGSYGVTMADGSRGIFKPSSTEFAHMSPDVRLSYYVNFPQGSQYAREIAVSRIDDALGFDLVPTTTVWGDAQLGVGSVQRINEGVSPSRPASSYETVDQHRMAVLDYITGNSDRHSNNYLTDVSTGRPVAIDHGLTLPVRIDGTIESDFVALVLRRPLNAGVLAQVRAIDSAQLRDTLLDSGMEFTAVANALGRLDEIQRLGMITGENWAGSINRKRI